MGAVQWSQVWACGSHKFVQSPNHPQVCGDKCVGARLRLGFYGVHWTCATRGSFHNEIVNRDNNVASIRSDRSGGFCNQVIMYTHSHMQSFWRNLRYTESSWHACNSDYESRVASFIFYLGSVMHELTCVPPAMAFMMAH